MQPLGVGGTGETWLVRRNDTGQEEAVKVISRGPLLKNLQRLLTNEITLQAELSEGNVNIVDAHEVLLTETHLCLFMEYIAGGTLTDYVSNRCETTDQRGGLFLDEMEARYLFRVRLSCTCSRCGVSCPCAGCIPLARIQGHASLAPVLSVRLLHVFGVRVSCIAEACGHGGAAC